MSQTASAGTSSSLPLILVLTSDTFTVYFIRLMLLGCPTQPLFGPLPAINS